MQSIVAEKRDVVGKKTKSLRKQGFLPAVIYGKGQPSESLAVKEGDFLKLWRSAGESSIVSLDLGGREKKVLIQDVARDPLTDKPVHVDFYIVDMAKKLRVSVPLEFIGESEAVKSGGILVKVLHALEVEVLPKDLPHTISVDISKIKNVGESVSVKDIKVPAGVEILANPKETVVMVEALKAEEEVKAEEAPLLESIEILSKKPKTEEAEGEAKSDEKAK